MLKIKDNIDLKELEKFGFIKNNRNYEFLSNGLTAIIIDEYRNIYKYLNCYQSPDYDVIYDLTLAGLVEKVVE